MANGRKPVRAELVELRVSHGAAVVQHVAVTPERAAKGDLRRVTRFDDKGIAVQLERSVTPDITLQLTLAGELGENVPRLLQAAEWFIEQVDLAQLRGRSVHSQLALENQTIGVDGRIARKRLARAYDAIGPDCFGALTDALVWEVIPRGPNRRALFRAGLRSLARALGPQTQKAPDHLR